MKHGGRIAIQALSPAYSVIFEKSGRAAILLCDRSTKSMRRLLYKKVRWESWLEYRLQRCWAGETNFKIINLF